MKSRTIALILTSVMMIVSTIALAYVSVNA